MALVTHLPLRPSAQPCCRTSFFANLLWEDNVLYSLLNVFPWPLGWSNILSDSTPYTCSSGNESWRSSGLHPAQLSSAEAPLVSVKLPGVSVPAR
ncbi:rCG24103 [Rattus norvegicus]|uniref:RCG24103 n=1 Tax=Rattus norvegicus TaxID=10116 RepID=A6KAN2_RAT|nr:rCG24103 [Rattus norvegicus]